MPNTSKKRPPLIDAEGEIREVTLEDFKQARPMKEVLSPKFFAMIEAHNAEIATKRKRSQKESTKKQTTVQLDADILASFKKEGAGWEMHINTILRDWLAQHRS